MFPPLSGSQAERVYQLAAAHRFVTSLPPGGPTRSRYDDAAGAPSCCELLLCPTTPARGRPGQQAAPGRHDQAASLTQSDSCSSASSEIQQREDTGGLVKGAWSTEEDMQLLQYVQEHGSKNWGNIQRVIRGFKRCGKSCRLRWVNHLRGGLKKTALSRDEERRVLELHATHGNKWAKIAAELPGRTDNEVKNFWNGRQKRIIRAKQLATRPVSGGHAYPRSLPCQPPASARPWMPRMAGCPSPSSSWPPPAPFLPRSSLPPRQSPAAPPGRSFSSSAGSGLFPSGAPPPQRSSQPWAAPPRLPAISRGFWVPPLVIPEVPPLEDDDGAGAAPPGQPALSSPPRLALPERLLGSSLHPLYRYGPPLPPAWKQAGPPPAWRPQDHGWGPLPLCPPNTLSPPPKPPVVCAATPNVDAFLISPSEADEDGFLHDWRDSMPLPGPPSRKRSRDETVLAGDSGTTDLHDAWRWAPVQAAQPTWDGDSGTVCPGGAWSGKRCKMEESEGECESGITFDTLGGGPDALSGCLLRAPLASPGPSSWPAWLDEASPQHRLEVEAAAASLYPTATAFLASVQQPEWGPLASEAGPQWALPPLVPVEELGTCVGEDGQGERLNKIASWSNFLCAAAGL